MSHTEASAGGLRNWLARAPLPVFALYGMAVAYSTYFCMYAFRKPFAAAKFEGEFFFGTTVALKTALVISQILGYALSKYAGIKVCSEVSRARRAVLLLALVVWAEAALVLCGLLPNDWKVVALFLNGLPLGMVWGLVVRYLEGRRTSELLLAGLSCSYIMSSGVVKDIGRAILEGTAADWWRQVPLLGGPVAGALAHVSEGWMPAVTGLHFLPLFFISVWLLNQMPPPDAADVAARAERVPMGSKERLAFARRFLFGLGAVCVSYFFLTAYRDFRDNYQVELFDSLGYSYAGNKAIITRTETMVSFGVMAALALLTLIKSNRWGLIGAFAIMAGGVGLLGVGTLLWQAGRIGGFWWMALTGLGSYLAYVPFGSALFERVLAYTRTTGTAVFAIYVADALGYTGSVGVQLFKDLFQRDVPKLVFFTGFTYFMSVLGLVCLVSGCLYFVRQRPAGEARAGKVPSRG